MKSNSTEGYHRPRDLAGAAAPGLEHSCMVAGLVADMVAGLPDGAPNGLSGGLREGIVEAPSQGGIERIEARFRGIGFSPHRHDTYGLGLTLSGVQSFHYRGSERHSQVGNVIVLHPDELHDGSAGTEDGLRYRMLYLPPERLIEAGGAGRMLPFIAGAVVEDAAFRACLAEALEDLETVPTELWLDGCLADIAACLWRHADAPAAFAGGSAAGAMLQRCCDYLRAHSSRDVSSLELEQVSGLDRFTIARQFRRFIGTSPHRYLIMRRLERARALIGQGMALAPAAMEAGFADQAHLTRHFKKSFGITPGRFAALRQSGRHGA